MSLISLTAIAIIIYVIYQISENESKKKAAERRRIAEEQRRREEIEKEIREYELKALDTYNDFWPI